MEAAKSPPAVKSATRPTKSGGVHIPSKHPLPCFVPSARELTLKLPNGRPER